MDHIGLGRITRLMDLTGWPYGHGCLRQWPASTTGPLVRTASSFCFGYEVAKLGLLAGSKLTPSRPTTAKVSSAGQDVGAAKKEHQNFLWQDFFSDPKQWWDNRQTKKSPQHPDFRHKTKNAALWIKSSFNPSWVATELANLAKCEEATCDEDGAGMDTSSTVINCEDTQELCRLCEEGRLEDVLEALKLRRLQGFLVSREVYWALLQYCNKKKSLNEARLVHAHIASAGGELSKYLGNALVNSYVLCGSVSDALIIFDKLPQRAVVSWTSLISGLTKTGQALEALKLYQRMHQERIKPNTYTYVGVLKACGSLADLEQGKAVHREVRVQGCETDLFVGTALVDMYAKCGSMKEAHDVFVRLHPRDVVSWTAMITGYSHQEQGDKALQLYSDMKDQGISPDQFIFASVLKACGSIAALEEAVHVDGQVLKLKALEKGKQIHDEIIGSGYQSDVFVGTGIVDMYSKCGSMVDAQRVFDTLLKPTVVSWNALITGYVQQEQYATALDLYAQMQAAGVNADSRTFLTLLRACISLAASEEDTLVNGQRLKSQALERGKLIHSEAVRLGCDRDSFLGNSLVHLYTKCGDMVEAEKVFDILSKRDVVSWRAMAAGYAYQGLTEKAWQIYTQMQQETSGAL